MPSKEKVLEIVDRKHAEARAEIEALEEETSGELEAVRVELAATKELLLQKDAELSSAKALLAQADLKAKEIDALIPDA